MNPNNNIKHLFFIRDGEHDLADMHLTELGQRQMTRLAESIKDIICDGKTYILASNAPSTSEGAEIIRQYLGTAKEPTLTYHLRSGRNAPLDEQFSLTDSPRELNYLIGNMNGEDSLIILTHEKILKFMPNQIMMEQLHTDYSCIPMPLKGQMIYVNAETKKPTIIDRISK